MLFPFYASFRWANKKNYVFKTVAFAVMSSLLSTVFGLNIMTVYLGPVSLLSFPLYGVYDETWIPPLTETDYGEWEDYYQMRFLGNIIYSADPVAYAHAYQVTFLSINIGSFPHRGYIPTAFLAEYFGNPWLFALPLLLLLATNSIGALTGFLTSKSSIAGKSELRQLSLLGRVVLGPALVIVALMLPLSPFDACCFFVFGIAWLVLIVGEHLLAPKPSKSM